MQPHQPAELLEQLQLTRVFAAKNLEDDEKNNAEEDKGG